MTAWQPWSMVRVWTISASACSSFMVAPPADGSQQLVRGDTLQWLNLEVRHGFVRELPLEEVRAKLLAMNEGKSKISTKTIGFANWRRDNGIPNRLFDQPNCCP